MQAGDRIIEIDGVNHPTWGQVALELQLGAVTGKVKLVIERESRNIPVMIPLKGMDAAGSEFAAVGYPKEAIIIDRITPEMPADRAGLQPGDVIVGANGAPLTSRYPLLELIRNGGGSPVAFQLKRGDKELTLQVRPAYTD